MKKEVSPRDSWIMLGPGQKIYVDEKIAKSWQEQRKALREIRGNVLALSIEIELILDQILIALFFPKDITNENLISIRKLFDNFLLKERPMSFNSKILLFRKLKEHYLLKDENLTNLLSNLEKIKDTRNRFAHNTLAFVVEGESPEQKLTPKLTCYDKDIILNNDYFDELNGVYKFTRESIENLVKKLS